VRHAVCGVRAVIHLPAAGAALPLAAGVLLPPEPLVVRTYL
jgi:Ni,Fe-hydrogenase I large subunit